jgi:uncharacterized protein DUF6882
MNTAEYEKLVTEARSRGTARIEAAKQKYGLGTYSRYEIDLPTATIKFLDDKGAEKIRSDIQAAGSWSSSPTTWLWSWDNESIPEKAQSRMARVREFGEQHEIEHVMGSFDPCPEEEAWTVTSIAAQVLDAECIYRAPGKNTNLFLLLFNIQKLP